MDLNRIVSVFLRFMLYGPFKKNHGMRESREQAEAKADLYRQGYRYKEADEYMEKFEKKQSRHSGCFYLIVLILIILLLIL